MDARSERLKIFFSHGGLPVECSNNWRVMTLGLICEQVREYDGGKDHIIRCGCAGLRKQVVGLPKQGGVSPPWTIIIGVACLWTTFRSESFTYSALVDLYL